jgi:hypothetical protein
MSLLAAFFVYEVSGEVMAKFCQKTVFYREEGSARNADSVTSRVSDYRNSQITNRLEPFDGPAES